MKTIEKMKSAYTRFAPFTPGGLVRWAWEKAARRETIVTGVCLRCGRCCRMLNLSFGGRWIRDEKQFSRLLAQMPEYERFRKTGVTLTGLLIFECVRLSPDGTCGDYENRPDVCREYPRTDLAFTGGELLDHCGFKLVSVPSFRKILERERGAGRTHEEKNFVNGTREGN